MTRSAPFLAAVFLTLGAAAQPSSAPAQSSTVGAVSVSGTHLLRDGQPWAPHGVMMVAFVAPPAAQHGTFTAAYEHYSPAEFAAIKTWGADTVRLQVSQPGADPKSPLYTEAFVAQVKQAVLAARAAGLNVIVSIQDESQSGEPSPAQLPDAGTGRVWQVLAPMFKDDPGVLYELLNEPQAKATPENWRAWATNTNIMIAIVRRLGSKNVLIADALAFAEHMNGTPTLTDPLKQVVYASHPYAHNAGGQSESDWNDKFGDFAKHNPLLISEWTSAVPYYCDGKTPAATLAFFHYLEARGLGVVMVAFDFGAAKKFGSIVQDLEATPSTFVGKSCGDPGYGPGKIVQDWYRTGKVPTQIE